MRKKKLIVVGKRCTKKVPDVTPELLTEMATNPTFPMLTHHVRQDGQTMLLGEIPEDIISRTRIMEIPPTATIHPTVEGCRKVIQLLSES